MEGSRKIIAAGVVVAVGVAVVIVKGDVPPGLGQLLGVVFSAFVVGNGIEHAASAYRDVNGNGVPDDEEDVVVSLPADPAALTRIEDGVAKVQEALAFIIQRVFPQK